MKSPSRIVAASVAAAHASTNSAGPSGAAALDSQVESRRPFRVRRSRTFVRCSERPRRASSSPGPPREASSARLAAPLR